MGQTCHTARRHGGHALLPLLFETLKNRRQFRNQHSIGNTLAVMFRNFVLPAALNFGGTAAFTHGVIGASEPHGVKNSVKVGMAGIKALIDHAEVMPALIGKALDDLVGKAFRAACCRDCWHALGLVQECCDGGETCLLRRSLVSALPECAKMFFSTFCILYTLGV